MTLRVWKHVTRSAFVLASATRLAAQEPASPYRYTVEAFAARYAVDQHIGTSRQRFDGFGLRVTLDPPDPDRAVRNVVDRATGSLWATYTTSQGTPGVSTLHVGVQTDFSMLARPAVGHVDPFFGLGIGIFRTSREDIVTRGKRVNRADLSLSPGVGLRVPFHAGLGARGDVRAPLIFGTSTTANVVAEAGLYFSF